MMTPVDAERGLAAHEPELWTSTLLASQPHLVHGMTKRGLNMALTVGPDASGSVDRRRRVCEAMGVPFDRLTASEQVHAAQVALVTGSRIGCGRDRTETRIAGVDGLVTDEPDVPLMVIGADCCLILVYDPKKRAVGVAHAGWRGTAAGVVRSLLGHMVTAYECRLETLLAAIGPCAGPCCYEVNEDVVSTFAAVGHNTSSVVDIRNGAMFLDLPRSNAMQLAECGVDAERIEIAGLCTICSDAFYSHRREPGAGQHALFAAVR